MDYTLYIKYFISFLILYWLFYFDKYIFKIRDFNSVSIKDIWTLLIKEITLDTIYYSVDCVDDNMHVEDAPPHEVEWCMSKDFWIIIMKKI